MSPLPKWKFFWDLQCPYSRKNWLRFEELQDRFGKEFVFEIHLTSLLFHPYAFTAQCAANLVNTKLGPKAKQQFVDGCFERQDRYMKAALPNPRPSEVDQVFATIAKEIGLFNTNSFTEDYFVSHLHDWNEAVLPAWNEHKIALGYGAYGTPKFVINDRLIDDTDSAWGPDEWADKLKTLNL